jgi:hypothetical protein
MDVIAGNIGRNNKWRVGAATPMHLYAEDFDGNTTTDIIPSYYMKNSRAIMNCFLL